MREYPASLCWPSTSLVGITGVLPDRTLHSGLLTAIRASALPTLSVLPTDRVVLEPFTSEELGVTPYPSAESTWLGTGNRQWGFKVFLNLHAGMIPDNP